MNKIRKNEQGIASIMIALVMILVLALLTIGFAQLSRREQRGALDRQLSNQAYYAAESGINDAYRDIQSGQINSGPTGTSGSASSTVCMTPNSPTTKYGTKNIPSTAETFNQKINSSVSYSCLLVNLQPPSLIYDSVSPFSGRSTTFSATNSAGAPSALNEFTVVWSSDNNRNTKRNPPPAPATFETDSSWSAGNHPAVIQFSVTKLGNGSVNRSQLINNTFTVYLYPSRPGAGRVAYSSAASQQGQIVSGNCTGTPLVCKVTIEGIPGVAGDSFLIHFVGYYDKSNIAINDAKQSDGTKLNFEDGQAQIDVTGKARNVLQRRQVRVALEETGNQLPIFAIEAKNICKRFKTQPADTTFFDTNASPTPATTAPVNDPECILSP